jgi:hypothetical protein
MSLNVHFYYKYENVYANFKRIDTVVIMEHSMWYVCAISWKVAHDPQVKDCVAVKGHNYTN